MSPVWPEAHIHLLKKLHGDGLTANQIATAISHAFLGTHYSRCAVIGKLHRLGIFRAPVSSPTRFAKTPKASSVGANNPLGPRKAVQLVAERAQAKAFGSSKVPPIKLAGNGVVFQATDVLPTLPPINASAWQPLPGSTPVTLMQLGAHACKWPVELAGSDDHHFCGLGADETYCARHAARSAVPAASKARLDERLGIPAAVRAA